MNWAYNSVNNQLIVGHPADNVVSFIQAYTFFQRLPVVFRN